MTEKFGKTKLVFRSWGQQIQEPASSGAMKAEASAEPSGHYSRDWSESVNVIGVISEPFAREFR